MCIGEPAALGAVQTNDPFSSSLLTVLQMQTMNYNSAPSWSHQAPKAEQPTPCSLLKSVPKEQPGAYEYDEAVIMCVLKIQSQLVLQDFMLQTLESLNNNILFAFHVAPVNPEGPKPLQKLCVVVAVKKLRNYCLSCLQEAEM